MPLFLCPQCFNSFCPLKIGERTEYSLLELLLRQQGRLISRGTIIARLWSFEETPSEETVKVHLKALRRKLKAVGAPADLVETVYGMGYRLKEI